MENTTPPNSPNKPNIILITVDQMRFPMNFPKDIGIDSPEKFISKYMPNLFNYLWNPGVKFSNYYTTASDCTSRNYPHRALRLSDLFDADLDNLPAQVVASARTASRLSDYRETDAPGLRHSLLRQVALVLRSG